MLRSRSELEGGGGAPDKLLRMRPADTDTEETESLHIHKYTITIKYTTMKAARVGDVYTCSCVAEAC